MPRPTVDILGQRFGMLVVGERLNGKGRVKWHCRCDCGGEVDVIGNNLQSGHTSSCGCKQRLSWQNALPKVTKHGHTSGGQKTREYLTWRGAWQRCFDPNIAGWRHYGGRGITMCAHWEDNFLQFFADMGNKPEGMTIDRIDNDSGYLCPKCCPPDGNCHWATYSDQLKNQRHEEFHDERSARKTGWWMNQTKEYRHKRAVDAANARWGRAVKTID